MPIRGDVSYYKPLKLQHGLVNGPTQLHAVVALGKFAYWAVTTASGVARSLRVGGWQETCFGHVPFQAGRHAEFEETMRAGHDAVERWLLTASPFVYPYGRGRHGDFDELSADEERTMLPQWTAVIVLRVSAGGNSAIIPIVFGGGNFRNEMASPVKPIKE
ncbi:hypothetical protein PPROV_001126300 [Pycnococcus provasolii]|uniref:Uncharacterized protein n=1 Tax=Pycnococcus provasolii TaxID=41880 RepID=A0A830I132_9CHLO|nr:hypothetical protein PPROV_001126300 [Pycnococcus provasolii]